ncbi:MAG TPA: DUF1572 family protein [Gemmatimonadaceae bacterium]|nr:DUF1572 family protein [Gemmatimonadaceae bacterium]
MRPAETDAGPPPASDRLAAAYLADAAARFDALRTLAERAAAQVDDEAFFLALDPDGNSVATLMKHMAGNLRSRFTDFLTTDGEKPDRDRDAEFEREPADTRASILARWAEGWNALSGALGALGPADLLREVTIRGEPHSVLQALSRQLAHQAQHAGQIVLLARHHAGPRWQTLSVPRGRSAEYTREVRARQPRGPA